MRIRLKLYILLLFVFFTSLVYSSSTDSLKQLLIENKEDTNQVNYLNRLCLEYQKMGSYDSALFYGNTAFKIAKKITYKKGIASAYINIGLVDYYQGDFNAALKKYFIALKIFEKDETSSEEGVAAVYNNIGMIYERINRYDDALKNYGKALTIRKKIGNEKGLATSYNNIGIIQSIKKSYKKADDNFKKSLKLWLKLNDKKSLSLAYNNIGFNLYSEGDAFQKSGSPQKAKRNFKLAFQNYYTVLELQKQIGNKRSIALSYSNIGETYLKIGEYLNAKKEYEKALELSTEIGEVFLLKDIYIGLALVNEKLGNYKEAYQQQQLYSKYKEKIFDKESTRQIEEIQAKYETEKKQKTIEIQSLQLSKQQLQITQNKVQVILLIAGMILIVIITYLIINRNKAKQRAVSQKNILTQQKRHAKTLICTLEQERIRIARDLHDGIGQTLVGAITNHEQLSTELNSFSENKKQIFNSTSIILDTAYKELRELSHQMMPRVLELTGLSEAISDLLDKSLKTTLIDYSFDQQPINEIPENIAISIYRIFQELLSNIIKHSEAKSILINLYRTQQRIMLIVEDDGIGIKDAINSSKAKSNGIGLMNITARTQIMNGTFLIEKGKIKGTTSTLIIPLDES